MNETPDSINTWAERTFGSRSAVEAVTRCNVEMAEMLSAIQNRAPVEMVTGELADVYIVVCQVPEILGATHPEPIEDERYDDRTVAQLARQLNLRLAHLLVYLDGRGGGRPYPKWKRTYSHIMTILQRLAQELEVDLGAVVDAKMAINRSRRWALAEDGRHQHV